MASPPAHRYHQLSSYVEDRHWLVPADDPEVRQDFVPMRPDSRPPLHKTYAPSQLRVKLPADVVDCREWRWLDISYLSALLHWSAGAVRQREDRKGKFVWFRAAASAGNMQPVEVYVHSVGVPGVDDGTWFYSPVQHELIRVGAVAGPQTSIVLTGARWRSEWRYAERGYRHLWWDAGAIASQLDLLAGSASGHAQAQLQFSDADVASTVGCSGDDEYPLAIINLDGGRSVFAPVAQADAGDIGTPGPDFPLVRNAHEAGRLASWDQRAPVEAGDRPAMTAHPGVFSAAVDLARRRAACRVFGSGIPVTASDIMAVMAQLARPINWDCGQLPIGLRLIVHDIAGLGPGIYQVSETALDVVTEGDLGLEAISSCMKQDLAGAGSCLALFTADMETIFRHLGQRGYRAMQFGAGLLVGRLQLCATGAGLAATPLTVCDEAAARLSPPGHVPLLAVVLGRRAHPPTLAGLPRGGRV
jgi:SagB-type dehydrogenase family enzyme